METNLVTCLRDLSWVIAQELEVKSLKKERGKKMEEKKF